MVSTITKIKNTMVLILYYQICVLESATTYESQTPARAETYS